MASIIGSGLESYVHSQARKRALDLIGEAKAEASHLLEQATAEAEAMRREINQHTAGSIGANQRQAIAHTRLRARQTLLQRREQLLERVWGQAEAQLRAYAQGDPARRLALIEQLLADAAGQLSGGPLEMGVAQQDRELMTPEVLQGMEEHLRATHGVTSLTMAETMVPAWGGVIARRVDANQIVDNSLVGRLALAKSDLRDEVSGLLLPQDDLTARVI